MVQVKCIEPKISNAKKTITIKNAIVKELRFVDETGDVTDAVLDAIPADVDTITVKISIELPDADES